MDADPPSPPDQAGPGRPTRLAYLVTHPIQYQAPLLRRIAAMPNLDLHVFFQSDISTRPFHDLGFDRPISWDVPLLDGYAHSFLPARIGSPERITAYLPISKGLGRALRDGRFDALWMHGYVRPYNVVSAFQARAMGVDVLMRDDVHRAGNRRLASREAAKRLHLILMSRLGVGFLATGRLNADYYRELGVAEDHIFTAPYAVDNAHFRRRIAEAAPRRETLRAELGLTDTAPVILFAGKFIARKRPQDLLAAYRAALARIEARGGAAPWLVFAGSGEGLEAMRAASADLGRVRFLGFQSQAQLSALFDLCDLFVMPSAVEPWGLVVNEVMNAGKPVIVTDECGCGPDLVKPGENGFIYPVGDVERLAGHLAELCCDPALRARMAAASLDIVSGWDFEADVRALAAALDWLAARRRPQRRRSAM